jgi:hypothetical protein
MADINIGMAHALHTAHIEAGPLRRLDLSAMPTLAHVFFRGDALEALDLCGCTSLSLVKLHGGAAPPKELRAGDRDDIEVTHEGVAVPVGGDAGGLEGGGGGGGEGGAEEDHSGDMDKENDFPPHGDSTDGGAILAGP